MPVPPSDYRVELSVVVPVFGSESTLVELHQRLTSVLESIDPNYEIIFVDDCGPSGSLQILRTIARQNPHVVVVEMLKNVGQVSATAHGISVSKGRLIVTIDDDLQQWPEDIRTLHQEIVANDFDLVVGRFPVKKHSLIRNAMSEVARRLAVLSLPVDKATHFTSFRIMKREVFSNYFGSGSLLLAQPGWMYITAPRHSEIDVRHSERSIGKSSYSLSSLFRAVRPLMKVVIDGSLQILIIASCVQILAALCGGIYLGIQYSRGQIDSPGFTSIVFLLLAIIGILGVGLGLLSQYLRSIKQLIVSKPHSLVRTVYSSSDKN